MKRLIETYLTEAIRSAELTLKESRKRIERRSMVDALWFLWRGFQELEEIETLASAIERDDRERAELDGSDSAKEN
jgi:hypothetical protein